MRAPQPHPDPLQAEGSEHAALLASALPANPRPTFRTNTQMARARTWGLALRLVQWSKNAVLLAGVVFAHRLGDVASLSIALVAVIAFSLVSSGIYLVNDVHDAPYDRHHPTKRLRPVARGAISPRAALSVSVLLLVVGCTIAALIRPAFLLVVVAYIALMLAYSVVLKSVVLVDVFVIAAGFVLRAVAGSVAVDVPISAWLLLCTMLLALFLGFCKRRHELNILGAEAAQHRTPLGIYSNRLLDQLIAATAGATIVAYSIYTFDARWVPANNAMMLTIPFVVFALFRYLLLVYRRGQGGNPEWLLFRDRPLLAAIVGWALSSLSVLYLV